MVCIMRALIASALIALATPAAACDSSPDSVSVLLGSHHLNAQSEYNEFNPGIMVSWDCADWSATTGVYLNSFDDLSPVATVSYDLMSGDDWAVSVFGGGAYYPDRGWHNGENLGGGVVAVGGLQAQYGNFFAQAMPGDSKYVDAIFAAGLTFDLGGY